MQPWHPVPLNENRLLCIGKEKCPKRCLLPHCAHFPRSLGRRTPSSTGLLKSQDIDVTLLCNHGNAEHVSMLCGGFTNMKYIIKMERTGTLVLFLSIWILSANIQTSVSLWWSIRKMLSGHMGIFVTKGTKKKISRRVGWVMSSATRASSSYCSPASHKQR